MKPWRTYGLLCPALALLGACGQQAAPGPGGNAAKATGAAGAVAAAVSHYEGLCEASAAVVLDGAHFAVASDETETLTIYRRGQPAPVRTVQHGGVTDIEGAARIGDTIFWLTSHSLTNGNVDKPKRKMLFTMAVASGPTMAETGSSVRDLRVRIAALLGIEEAALTPWLNIEGVAALPPDDLLIGLRGAPAGETRAYVVRIDNPLAPGGAPAPGAQGSGAGAPARVWRLDLGGRGVRSMERVGEGAHAYLILAGPRADGPSGFALFWWDGVGEAVTPGPAMSFGDMVPEALIAWSDGEIQILGDNGANCSDETGDPGQRRFPSRSLRL